QLPAQAARCSRRRRQRRLVLAVRRRRMDDRAGGGHRRRGHADRRWAVMAGQRVVATGAGHGIGRALATRMAAEGCRVLVNDLDTAAAEQGAGEIGAEVRGGDAASEEGGGKLVHAARGLWGGVDVGSATAGIDRGRGLAAREDAWAASFEVNARAHARAARLLVPQWLERASCRFVVTASAAGLLTLLGSPAYSASN